MQTITPGYSIKHVFVLGLLIGAGIVSFIGALLIVVGAILWILGAVGHQVGRRPHYY